VFAKSAAPSPTVDIAPVEEGVPWIRTKLRLLSAPRDLYHDACLRVGSF
jgi:hypothetical protein